MTRWALVLSLLQDPSELHCLAQTIYFEGRSEPPAAQMLIAQTVMVRLNHPDYPKTICAVVQEARKPGLYSCQFHWWCDGKSDRPHELQAWRRALGYAWASVLVGPLPPAPTHFRTAGSLDPWGFETVAVQGSLIFSIQP